MEIEFTKHFGKTLMSVAMNQPGTAKILADDIGEATADYCRHLFQIMANCHEQDADSFTVIIRTDTATNK